MKLVNDIIIDLKNVTKTFKVAKRKSVFSNIKNSSLNNKIVALNDVTFAVKKGEILGIIGNNGSGKTTLMQVIAGVYQPDLGSVKVEGTLAPILQIGAGFHHELTSQENILIYGMMLGLSKSEISGKVNQILEFSELEKFSNMKLKNFSSGMKSRLAVSTIFQLNPDIFLLDEILAVGDINFREKCFRKFSTFKEKETTILHTTHNLTILPKLFDRVLVLNEGKIIFIGKPDEAIQKYKEISLLNKRN